MPVVTRRKAAAIAQEQKSRDIWARYVPAELDLSKMPKKPISEGFVFPKSTEQKLAETDQKLSETEQKLSEALAEIEALKKKCSAKEASIWGLIDESFTLNSENATLKNESDSLKKKNENLEANVKYLEGEIDSWKEQYGSAVDTCKKLRERIANPFKGAISSPYY